MSQRQSNMQALTWNSNALPWVAMLIYYIWIVLYHLFNKIKYSMTEKDKVVVSNRKLSFWTISSPNKFWPRGCRSQMLICWKHETNSTRSWNVYTQGYERTFDGSCCCFCLLSDGWMDRCQNFWKWVLETTYCLDSSWAI